MPARRRRARRTTRRRRARRSLADGHIVAASTRHAVQRRCKKKTDEMREGEDAQARKMREAKSEGEEAEGRGRLTRVEVGHERRHPADYRTAVTTEPWASPSRRCDILSALLLWRRAPVLGCCGRAARRRAANGRSKFCPGSFRVDCRRRRRPRRTRISRRRLISRTKTSEGQDATTIVRTDRREPARGFHRERYGCADVY